MMITLTWIVNVNEGHRGRREHRECWMVYEQIYIKHPWNRPQYEVKVLQVTLPMRMAKTSRRRDQISLLHTYRRRNCVRYVMPVNIIRLSCRAAMLWRVPNVLHRWRNAQCVGSPSLMWCECISLKIPWAQQSVDLSFLRNECGTMAVNWMKTVVGAAFHCSIMNQM